MMNRHIQIVALVSLLATSALGLPASPSTVQIIGKPAYTPLIAVQNNPGGSQCSWNPPTTPYPNDTLIDHNSFDYGNATGWYSLEPDTTSQSSQDGNNKRSLMEARQAGGTRKFSFNSDDLRDLAALNIILVIIRNTVGDGLLQFLDQSSSEADDDFLTGAPSQSWQGDHTFEIQLLKNWFQTNPTTGNGINWPQIWDNLQNCPSYTNRVTLALNNVVNIVGLPNRLNNLKGILVGGRIPGAGTWYRAEYEALQQAMQLMHDPAFTPTVNRVAEIMNQIWQNEGSPGPSNATPPGNLFSAWAEQQWQNALTRITNTLNDPNTQFKDDSQWGSDYKSTNLP